MPETNAHYHADFGYVSHSMLEVFRKSPAEYHARYIAQTLAPADPSPEMALGSVTHCLTLEPARFEEEYLVAEGCKQRSGARWEDWQTEARAVGKTLVLPEQHTLAGAMADAVRRHPKAREFIEAGGIVERPIRWTDEAVGIPCKCKPDSLIPLRRGLVIWDLKTAADPHGQSFGRQAGEYGYLRQAAHYIAGAKAKYGDLPVAWYWIVVGKVPPHDVWVYRLAPHQYAAGAAQRAATLADLRAALDSGRWLGECGGTPQEEICELEIPEHFLR